MPGHDIVVGTSAGGLEALTALARKFPPDLPAAIFIAQHIPAAGPSLLPEIMSRAGPLAAAHAVDGMPIQHSRIYIAPPDQHMLIERGQ
jgi:two-component system chemotaxis response regulator CheB